RSLAIAAAVSTLAVADFASGANTPVRFDGVNTGSLLTATNWDTDTLPTVSNDAYFSSTNTTGIRKLTSGDLTVGSFNVTATSNTYSIRNETTGATDRTLTLGG